MPFSFLPRMIFPHLTDVTAEALRARGISFLMLDFDNTIVPYTTSKPTAQMAAWIRTMQASEIRLCIVSNSKKPRVVEYCKTYGLDCITHAKKPFSRGIRACLTRYALDPAACALVGDQIFTDALGANLYGIPVLLVQPMRQDTKATIRLKRALEKPVLARYYKKGGRVHGKEEDCKPPDA